MGGGWSTPCLGRLTPRKESWYPLFKRLYAPQGQPRCVWKIPPSQNLIPGPPNPQCVTTLATLSRPGTVYCLLWWLDDTLQVTRWYMYPDKQWWQYVTDFWSATRPALSGVLAEREDVTWATACTVCDRGWTGVWLLLVPTHVFMEPIVLLVSLPHIILSWW